MFFWATDAVSSSLTRGCFESSLVVAGGVGANQMLRLALNQSCQAQGVRVHYPELSLCTDNGAMIAMAAALRLQAGMAQTQSDYGFDVRPRWPLEELSERIPI